ncbi:MAG: FCD domain-containing protein, partial [Bdellovibrionales bacterium]|nr:FCD domain-containing protein [Bdellovibrionales bacterium]
RKAVDHITDWQIDRMERLNQELRACYQRGDISGMIAVHNEFHDVFVRACGNERLSSLISNLVQQYQRFRIALSHTDAIEQSIALHQEIVEAFRARDHERVTALVAQNSSQGGENLINSIECVVAANGAGPM